MVGIGNNSFKSIVSDFLFKGDFFLFYLEGALHETSGPVCNLPLRLSVILFFSLSFISLIKKRFRPINLKAKKQSSASEGL